ncbi:hypothetical protein JB92DRAFT_3109267 [Gautieria morchelliformis]|nr:hypothetical protein JB92DRAFT_3109267 [Gautieria morchelliformis]
MIALTRTQFQQACEAFISKHETEHCADEFTGRGKQGWRWHRHSIVPGLGYMARDGLASRREHSSASFPEDSLTEPLEEDDVSALPPQPQGTYEVLTVHQSIVYSPTFQVPAFYFTVHDRNGSPLPLQDMIGTSLFRPHMFPRSISTASHGISMPDSNFPLLSQADHPVLGTPCWCFHPCETAAAVAELLEAAGDPGVHLSDQGLLRWMEAWFLVLCSVVDIQ